MPLPLSGMRRLSVEMFGIGLNDFPVLEKQQSALVGRHARDKGLGFRERFTQASHDFPCINRRYACDASKVGGGVTSVAADFVDEPFGREPRRFLHSGPNDRA